jgi:hypothetical protein
MNRIRVLVFAQNNSIARVELLKLYLDTRVSPVLCHVVSPRPIFFPHTTGNAKTTAFHEAPNIF